MLHVIRNCSGITRKRLAGAGVNEASILRFDHFLHLVSRTHFFLPFYPPSAKKILKLNVVICMHKVLLSTRSRIRSQGHRSRVAFRGFEKKNVGGVRVLYSGDSISSPRNYAKFFPATPLNLSGEYCACKPPKSGLKMHTAALNPIRMLSLKEIMRLLVAVRRKPSPP